MRLQKVFLFSFLSIQRGKNRSRQKDSRTPPHTLGTPWAPPRASGTDYPLGGADYVLDAGNGQCMLLVMSLDLEGTGVDWILGDVFMRK